MNQQFTSLYNSVDFSIPAPVLQANLYNIEASHIKETANFLLDTGSDLSMIKNDLFTKLELLIIGKPAKFKLADSDSDENKYVERNMTWVEIEIPELKFKGAIEVIIAEQGEDNILGRDFLEYFELILNRGKEFTIKR